MQTRRADDHGQMDQGFPSPHAAAPGRNGDLLDLVGELIDAHTDTVQLITGDEPTELAWLVHCDYLRALQRLGRETLAHHAQRKPTPPLGFALAAALTTAVTRGWTAVRVVLRSPTHAAHTLPLRPLVQLLEEMPV